MHDMLEVPAVHGFVAYDQDFRVTMSTASTCEPVVYVNLITEDLPIINGMSSHSISIDGRFLRPTFKRGRMGSMIVNAKIRIAMADASPNSLLAFVVVRTRAKLTRLSLVDSSYREIVGVPADVARFDANACVFAYDADNLDTMTYCLVLDSASWSHERFKDAIYVGGALDLQTQGDVYLSLDHLADDYAYADADANVDVHVMSCEWVRV